MLTGDMNSVDIWWVLTFTTIHRNSLNLVGDMQDSNAYKVVEREVGYTVTV